MTVALGVGYGTLQYWLVGNSFLVLLTLATTFCSYLGLEGCAEPAHPPETGA